MKRFLVKGTIFVLIGLLLLTAINQRYISTNGFKSLNDTQKFMDVPTGIEIANLGNSHGLHAFYYEESNVKGFNFALPAQIFYYDYQILQQYADHIKKGAVVLIPVSYFSFQADTRGDRFMEGNPRYYRFLDPKRIKFFSLADLIRYRFFPVISAEKNLSYILHDKGTDKNYWEIQTSSMAPEKMAKDGEETAERHLGFIHNGKMFEDENTQYLEKIIAYCQQQGFRPVLITTPYTAYYNQHFPEEVLAAFRQQVMSIARKYDVIYLDYSHDERFSGNGRLFIDSTHLNLPGRKQFSKTVWEDLRRLKLLP